MAFFNPNVGSFSSAYPQTTSYETYGPGSHSQTTCSSNPYEEVCDTVENTPFGTKHTTTRSSNLGQRRVVYDRQPRSNFFSMPSFARPSYSTYSMPRVRRYSAGPNPVTTFVSTLLVLIGTVFLMETIFPTRHQVYYW